MGGNADRSLTGQRYAVATGRHSISRLTVHWWRSARSLGCGRWMATTTFGFPTSQLPNSPITQLCGTRTENCPPGMKTGDQISPPGGYVGGGLQMQTDLAVGPAGDVWVMNNWQDIASCSRLAQTKRSRPALRRSGCRLSSTAWPSRFTRRRSVQPHNHNCPSSPRRDVSPTARRGVIMPPPRGPLYPPRASRSEHIVRQWPLQRLGLTPRRAHPHVPLFVGEQDHRHALRMDRASKGAGRSRRERTQVNDMSGVGWILLQKSFEGVERKF